MHKNVQERVENFLETPPQNLHPLWIAQKNTATPSSSSSSPQETFSFSPETSTPC